MSVLLDEEKTKNGEANKLSPTMKYAIVVLKNAIKDIINGECSEEDVVDMLAKMHPERHEYIKPSDNVNYDQAMHEMPFGYNRNKLSNLAKKYGVKNKRVNNMPIGFNIKEIKLLAQKAKEEDSK